MHDMFSLVSTFRFRPSFNWSKVKSSKTQKGVWTVRRRHICQNDRIFKIIIMPQPACESVNF